MEALRGKWKKIIVIHDHFLTILCTISYNQIDDHQINLIKMSGFVQFTFQSYFLKLWLFTTKECSLLHST